MMRGTGEGGSSDSLSSQFVVWLRGMVEEIRHRFDGLSDEEKLALKGIAVAGAVGGLLELGRKMMPKKVFISYDYDNDKRYRYLLSAWDANEGFDFEFEDHSTPYINSEDAGRIKAAIARKMANANCLLVIVGDKTATSTWVAWEIEKAKELGLSLVAVKIKNSYTTPSGLLGSGTHWALAFDRDPIASAINAA